MSYEGEKLLEYKEFLQDLLEILESGIEQKDLGFYVEEAIQQIKDMLGDEQVDLVKVLKAT